MSKTQKSTAKVKILSILILLILGLGLTAAVILNYLPADIRQQAAGCSETPVNVEFRKYTGKDVRGWMDGKYFTKLKVGDKLDVNCFAKNGSALLSNGKFTIKFNGQTTTIPAAAYKSATEIRGWQITKAGTWSFTCANSSGCSNTDSVTIKAATTTPTDQCTPAGGTCRVLPENLTVEPCLTTENKSDLLCADSKKVCCLPKSTDNPTCTSYQLSDLNQDCQTTLLDYDLFLKDFRDHYVAP